MNWLYLGKCYLSLKRMDDAKHWLQKVAESECTGATLDDYVSRVCMAEYAIYVRNQWRF